MGNATSSPLPSVQASTAAAPDYPSECPMHKDNQDKNAAAKEALAPTGGAPDYPSECPMHKSNEPYVLQPEAPKEGEFDTRNMMPAPNQRPSPGQPFTLPTERQTSSIPKAEPKQGESDKWVYPSQQMFWNAMLRKGWRWKDDDVTPDTMKHIIRIHNVNNEAAWREVLKWEAMHAHECGNPKLKHFGGKATDFSPRARFRGLMGYEMPFDRHDWIVDRCGREVRYVIDYYDGGDVNPDDHTFALLDVRPAIDSPQAVWDRMKVAWWRWRYAGPEEQVQMPAKSS